MRPPHEVAQLTAKEAAMLIRLGYGVSLLQLRSLTPGINDAGERFWSLTMDASLVKDPVSGFCARLIG